TWTRSTSVGSSVNIQGSSQVSTARATAGDKCPPPSRKDVVSPPDYAVTSTGIRDIILPQVRPPFPSGLVFAMVRLVRRIDHISERGEHMIKLRKGIVLLAIAALVVTACSS